MSRKKKDENHLRLVSGLKSAYKSLKKNKVYFVETQNKILKQIMEGSIPNWGGLTIIVQPSD